MRRGPFHDRRTANRPFGMSWIVWSEAFEGESADLAVIFASIHHCRDPWGKLGAELSSAGAGPTHPGMHRRDDHRRRPERSRAGRP